MNAGPDRAPVRGLVLGATLGDCVHVAGVVHFLALAKEESWPTHFLGPAQPIAAIVKAIDRYRPAIVGLSYRLGPETAASYLAELATALGERGDGRPRLVFGGTSGVCRAAEASGLFERVFPSSATAEEVRAFLRGAAGGRPNLDGRPVPAQRGSQDLVERIASSYPWPIFRHHFGLPSLEATAEGCARLAESGLVDVISLGPDQNTQERFFHADEIDENLSGAGGVPLRRPEDFRRLRQTSLRGNFPLMRCYSGTRDVLRLAKVLRETIDNAWCAVPLFWYNVLDARSDRPLRQSIRENMKVVAWHAEQGVPVEVNEAHHWSLREAPDAVAVAAAFLAAYNAKRRGVSHYVSQYMFNTPAGTWPEMDLGKMLAKIDLIEGLHDETFASFRQVRTGLSSFPADPDEAKGHLAVATWVQMALKPHIVHVVAYCEADHIATPAEIIESVKICRQVVREAATGYPQLALSRAVTGRREELVAEAKALLAAIADLAGPGVDDPWTDPETLARTVEVGLLDSPHLAGNPAAWGEVRTRMVDGKCLTVNPETGTIISERERIGAALARVAGRRDAGDPPTKPAPVPDGE